MAARRGGARAVVGGGVKRRFEAAEGGSRGGSRGGAGHGDRQLRRAAERQCKCVQARLVLAWRRGRIVGPVIDLREATDSIEQRAEYNLLYVMAPLVSCWIVLVTPECGGKTMCELCRTNNKETRVSSCGAGVGLKRAEERRGIVCVCVCYRAGGWSRLGGRRARRQTQEG